MPHQTGDDSLADLFWLLSNSTRLQIIDTLRHGDVCVRHLQVALKRRQANISQHLMLLRRAGIVEAHHEGVLVYYHRRVRDEIRAYIETLPEALRQSNGLTFLVAPV